jgi:hypothetical protein
MRQRTRGEPDRQLSLPKVDPATVKQFEGVPHVNSDLYDQLFVDNPELALFIRRRAQDLAPDDMDRREEISNVALEVIAIAKSQALINGLNRRLFGNGTDYQPPAIRDGLEAQLPPAA